MKVAYKEYLSVADSDPKSAFFLYTAPGEDEQGNAWLSCGIKCNSAHVPSLVNPKVRELLPKFKGLMADKATELNNQLSSKQRVDLTLKFKLVKEKRSSASSSSVEKIRLDVSGQTAAVLFFILELSGEGVISKDFMKKHIASVELMLERCQDESRNVQHFKDGILEQNLMLCGTVATLLGLSAFAVNKKNDNSVRALSLMVAIAGVGAVVTGASMAAQSSEGLSRQEGPSNRSTSASTIFHASDPESGVVPAKKHVCSIL